MDESYTVVSTYTMYSHLQQYCSHPSIWRKGLTITQYNFRRIRIENIENLKNAKMLISASDRVETLRRNKGENADYHHILLIPQCFQKLSLLKLI